MHLPIELYQLFFVFGRLELDKKGSIKHKIISFQLFYYDFNLLQNKIVYHNRVRSELSPIFHSLYHFIIYANEKGVQEKEN